MSQPYNVEHNFTYHPPNEVQAGLYELGKKEYKQVALFILDHCPDSRERSIALTNLEQSLMWANASIARNQEVYE